MYFTLTQCENGRFHIVSTRDTCDVFVALCLDTLVSSCFRLHDDDDDDDNALF